MSETALLTHPVISEASRAALRSPTIEAQTIKDSLRQAEGREDPEKAYKLVRLGKLALIGGKPIDAEKWAQSVTNKIDDPTVPDVEKDKYRPVAADAHALLES